MYLQFVGNETRQYDSLPVKIRLADGSTRTSLHELTFTQLNDLGVYRYEDITPSFDSYTHKRNGVITFDHDNRTWSEGIDPIDPNTLKALLISTIQKYLDTESQAHYYDGILSLCSYATSENAKFGPEGQAGVVWRDACWTKGYEILAECEAGTRAIPTPEELVAEMPSMEWPI